LTPPEAGMQMVYKLYNLTPEEIKIVEGKRMAESTEVKNAEVS
jgi:hypothetical protein